MTTYVYHDGGGGTLKTNDLKQISYSDGTTTVAYTYTRDGRIATVADATGSRTFAYDAATLERTGEDLDNTFFGSGRDLTREYSATAVGRLSGLEIGGGGSEYDAAYLYDAASGRLERVTGPGLPSYGVQYSYVNNSNLLYTTEFKSDAGTVVADSTRVYESNRDLLTSVDNWERIDAASRVSKYAYVNDALGRRTSCVRTGSAFTGGLGDHLDLWGYSPRNELTGSQRFLDTDPGDPNNPPSNPRHGYDEAYVYDPIGNRLSWTDGDPNDPNNPTANSYTANALNQYVKVSSGSSPVFGMGLEHDADGNLARIFLVGDIDGDGDVDFDDQNLLLASYGICSGQQGYIPEADLNDSGCVGYDDLNILLAHYGASNPTLSAEYTWNAENRLIGYTPLTPMEGAKKVAFAYDYMGRRVEKRVYDWDDPNGVWQTVPSLHRRFVWYNWLMIEELDVDPNSVITVLRQNTWGLDLSGTLENAGGIGGLLAVHDNDESDDYIHLYDANGNVGQVLDWSTGTTVAEYEYDPYGNLLASRGPYADKNPFRFSTKPFDEETGLYNSGERYYDPRFGRWINGDPAGEAGGLNLYAYVENDVVNYIDPLGTTPYTFEEEKAALRNISDLYKDN